MPLEVGDNEIRGYESICAINALTPIGTAESAWRATLECRGEGEVWTGDVIFALHRDPDGKPLTLVEIDMTDGSVVGYFPCD